MLDKLSVLIRNQLCPSTHVHLIHANCTFRRKRERLNTRATTAERVANQAWDTSDACLLWLLLSITDESTGHRFLHNESAVQTIGLELEWCRTTNAHNWRTCFKRRHLLYYETNCIHLLIPVIVIYYNIGVGELRGFHCCLIMRDDYLVSLSRRVNAFHCLYCLQVITSQCNAIACTLKLFRQGRRLQKASTGVSKPTISLYSHDIIIKYSKSI